MAEWIREGGMKLYIVEVDEESRDFLRSLPEHARHDARNILADIQKRGCAFLKACENKHGIDLKGCFSAYFGNTQYRIIAEEVDPGHIVIWSIGPRKNFEAFKTAATKRNQ